MNKQNLLSIQYLIKYYILYFIKCVLKCILPLIVLFLIFNMYSVFLDNQVVKLENNLIEIKVDKENYEAAEKEIEELKEILKSNEEKLSYVQSLQGDFSKFDILMSYLINTKPYDLALISVEDLDIVPPPDETSNIVNKDTVSDIFNDEHILNTEEINKKDENVEKTEEDNKKEETKVDENGNVVNNTIVSSEDTLDDWNTKKFDNSLMYTRDISFGNILIRGYGSNIESVSKYIESIAKAPEIEGYTLEAVEDKITVLEDINIILFEVKLKMKGVEGIA